MYDAYYGLSARPFRLAPDPALFYESKGHRSARRYLDYRASQGEGVIALTGEIGTGKTTLIRALAAALAAQPVVLAQLVDTGPDAGQLLQAVALAFGVPQPEPGAASALEEFLHGLQRIGKRALLIVDEAQNLSVEGILALHALAATKPAGVPLLQVFLVGQPELHTRVLQAWQQCAPASTVPTYHLGPLQAAETRAYIEHRLTAAGWRGDPVIDPEAYGLLHQISGGVPRRINALCNRLLLNGSINGTRRFGLGEVDAVAAELGQELGAYADELRSGSAAPQRPRGDASRPTGLSSLSARLDWLERASARLLELVQRVPARLAAHERVRRAPPRP